jgi:hypothetical protein
MLSATVSIVETQGGGHDDSLLELAIRRLYFFWVTSLVPGKEMWGRFGVSNLLLFYLHSTNPNVTVF